MSGRPCGLLEPGAATSGTPGSQGAPAQQCAGATRQARELPQRPLRPHQPGTDAAPDRADRPRTGAADPARPRHHLSAHPDLEGVHDPAKDAKLDRIEEVMSRFPDRVFAFDQFGPLSIRPCHGTCWAAARSTRTGCRRPTTATTASATSTAATTWPATSCGVCCTSTRAVHTPSPRSRASVPRAPTAHRSTSCWTTCPATPPRRSGHGPPRTRSSCARPRRTPAGPTRSRRSSGPCAGSRWPTPTTPATPPWPADYTPTCAGATPTPATPGPGRPAPRTRPRPQRERPPRWGRPRPPP